MRGRKGHAASAATLAIGAALALGGSAARGCTAPGLIAQDAAPPARPPAAAVLGDVATWGRVEVAQAGRPLVEGKSLRVDGEQVAAIANAHAGAFRNRYRDPNALDELVRDVAADRLLADEARRRGYARRPDVAHAIDELLARELLEDRLAALERQPVAEATLRAWYEAHIADFTRPPQVRARVLGVAEVLEARRLRARAERMSLERFGALVRRESEISGRSRRRGGDTGWFDHTAGTVDPALMRAALAGTATGLLPGVVKGDDGLWYVVWITEREGAEVRPFERVMRSVESRWRAERRAQATDALVADLAARRSVTIHPVSGVLRYAGGEAPDAGVPPGSVVQPPPSADASVPSSELDEAASGERPGASDEHP